MFRYLAHFLLEELAETDQTVKIEDRMELMLGIMSGRVALPVKQRQEHGYD